MTSRAKSAPLLADIRCEVDLTSAVSAEEIVRLAEIVQTRCPVLDVLSRPVIVHTSIALNLKGSEPQS
jgi:uncharacterized OsmC-like protein